MLPSESDQAQPFFLLCRRVLVTAGPYDFCLCKPERFRHSCAAERLVLLLDLLGVS
jgi:hypothetical protein